MFEVLRRFKDFASFYEQLQEKYPDCIVPPLPSKSVQDKMVKDESVFVEKRKQGLL